MLVDVLDGMGEQVGRRQHFDFFALPRQRNGVGNDQFGERRIFDGIIGFAGKYRVGTYGADTAGTIIHNESRGFGKRAGGIADIVDQHNVLTFDIANNGHGLDFIGAFTLLIADDHFGVKVFCEGTCAVRAAHIGGSNREIG